MSRLQQQRVVWTRVLKDHQRLLRTDKGVLKGFRDKGWVSLRHHVGEIEVLASVFSTRLLHFGMLVQRPPTTAIGYSGADGLEVMPGSQCQDERNCCFDGRGRRMFEMTEAVLVDDRKKIDVVGYGRILIW